MWTIVKQAITIFVVLTILTGVIYPLLVTGFAYAFFRDEAEGRPIVAEGEIKGSELIGQPFSDPKYFWLRPSATSPQPYNAAASSGSNLGPTNPALLKRMQERIEELRQAGIADPVPVDLVTASASGLDPHISPAAAEAQIARVVKARGVDANKVRTLVEENTESRQLGVLGEPRVNVLKLNLALDANP